MIQSDDLKHLSNLRSLCLKNNNRITNNDLMKFPQIVELTTNRITDLELMNLPGLTTLHLRGCCSVVPYHGIINSNNLKTITYSDIIGTIYSSEYKMMQEKFQERGISLKYVKRNSIFE
jgi:hypothetical protein